MTQRKKKKRVMEEEQQTRTQGKTDRGERTRTEEDEIKWECRLSGKIAR